MGQQAFSGIAVFVALIFLALALAACASSAHDTAPAAESATSEFHGADISPDALRSRLPSES